MSWFLMAFLLRGGGFFLAGDPVSFDAEMRPQFTERQILETAESTRAGFVKWAATGEGKRIISRFRTAEYEVAVIEDPHEEGPGRAPQPGLAILLAANDRSKVKRYEVILNPAFARQYGNAEAIDLGEPVTPRDVMAATWAAEMLHVDFYANGVPLPHHAREDFQKRWREVAADLGMPRVKHDSGALTPAGAPPPPAHGSLPCRAAEHQRRCRGEGAGARSLPG
jgi:hypothetical protein